MRDCGLVIRVCGLSVACGGPGAVGDVGAMARFAVRGRCFHHRKVGRN
jgi:hypothetical protein